MDKGDFVDGLLSFLAAVGGIGVLIIGIAKLAGNVFRDRLKERARRRTDEHLLRSKNELEVRRVQADRFANAQFELYSELWKALQDLREAGDMLWERVTRDNVERFAACMNEATSKVRRGEIFFEEPDLASLEQLFREFDWFHLGKITLLEIRSDRANRWQPFYSEDIAVDTIEQNRRAKADYETLLMRIRDSFRRRLSSLGDPTNNDQ